MGVGGPGSRSPREIAMIAIDNLIQVLLIQAVCSHSYTLPESLSHTLVLHILRKRSSTHTHAYREKTYKPTYPLFLQNLLTPTWNTTNPTNTC